MFALKVVGGGAILLVGAAVAGVGGVLLGMAVTLTIMNRAVPKKD